MKKRIHNLLKTKYMKGKKETRAERNAKFWALDKRNKRIAIAKDIIAQIDASKFNVRSGRYFELSKAPYGNVNLDTLINKKDTSCTVCALGACFFSLVNLGDRIKVADVIDIGDSWRVSNGYMSYINPAKMRKYLREIFSPEQISLIESAFEKVKHEDNKVVPSIAFRRKVRKAIEFGNNTYINNSLATTRRYNWYEGMLIPIMKNIIKNRGTFRPDKP